MSRRLKTIKARSGGAGLPELYHVSFNGDLPSTLMPKLPAGMEDDYTPSKAGKSKAARFPEPDDIRRVSFGLSIEGCIHATYPNWWHYFEDSKFNFPYVEMWVYRAVLQRGNILVSAETLSEERMVWDALANGEWWVIDPVSIEKFAKIRVDNANDKEPRFIHPYGDHREPKVEAGPKGFDIEIIEQITKPAAPGKQPNKLYRHRSLDW